MTDETTPELLGHDEAIAALCSCAATVTTLSYREAIEGYFKLRGLPIPTRPTMPSEVTEVLAAAYEAGAQAVHDEWDEACTCRCINISHPEFGEAASDYAASVALTYNAAAPKQAPAATDCYQERCDRCGRDVEVLGSVAKSPPKSEVTPIYWEDDPVPPKADAGLVDRAEKQIAAMKTAADLAYSNQSELADDLYEQANGAQILWNALKATRHD